jgi:hypothetical protein
LKDQALGRIESVTSLNGYYYEIGGEFYREDEIVEQVKGNDIFTECVYCKKDMIVTLDVEQFRCVGPDKYVCSTCIDERIAMGGRSKCSYTNCNNLHYEDSKLCIIHLKKLRLE